MRDAGTSDLDPDVPYTWRIDLHHDLHRHPIVSGVQTTDGTFEIPRENHGGTTALWYEFTLTMHAYLDSGEPIDVRVSEPLYPATSTVSIDTVPSHTDVTINYVNRTLPYTFTSITGVENSVEAPETILRQHQIYSFDEWSLSSMESASAVFLAPPGDTVLTGTYEQREPAYVTSLPLLMK